MNSLPKNPMQLVSRLILDPNKRAQHVLQFRRLLAAHTYVYERLRVQSTDPTARKYDPFIDGYLSFLKTTLPAEHHHELSEFKAHIKREEFDKKSSLMLYYMKSYPLSGKWLSFLSYLENNKLTQDITPDRRPLFQLYASRFEDYLMYDLHAKACPLSGLGVFCRFMEKMPVYDAGLSDASIDLIKIQLICTYLNEHWGSDYVAYVLEEISAVTVDDGNYLLTKKTLIKSQDKEDWESWAAVSKQLLNCYLPDDSLSKAEQVDHFQEKWHKLDFAVPYKDLRKHLNNDEILTWLQEATAESARDLAVVPSEHRSQLQTLPDQSYFYLVSFKALIYSDDSKSVDNTTFTKNVNYRSFHKILKHFGHGLVTDHDRILSAIALRKEDSQSLLSYFDVADEITNPQKMKTSAFLKSIPDKTNIEEYFHRYFETDKIIDLFEDHVQRQISFMRHQAMRREHHLTSRKSYGASIPPKTKNPLQDIAYVFKHKRANLKAAYFDAAVITCREIAEDGQQIDVEYSPDFSFIFWLHCTMAFVADFNERLKKMNTEVLDPNLMPKLQDMAAQHYIRKYAQHVENHFSVVCELYEILYDDSNKAA